MDPARIQRALLQNLATWIEDAEGIADDAGHGTPAKSRALHLARNMKQAEFAIKRMLGMIDGNNRDI